jgi:hypothetical protein
MLGCSLKFQTGGRLEPIFDYTPALKCRTSGVSIRWESAKRRFVEFYEKDPAMICAAALPAIHLISLYIGG